MLIIYYKTGDITGIRTTHFEIKEGQLKVKLKRSEMLEIHGGSEMKIDLDLCQRIIFNGEVLHEINEEKTDL